MSGGSAQFGQQQATGGSVWPPEWCHWVLELKGYASGLAQKAKWQAAEPKNVVLAEKGAFGITAV